MSTPNRRIVVGDTATQFSWRSQASQYAYRDTPGLSCEQHSVGVLGALTIVDCLLWRDEDGLLRGILNHYPDGALRYPSTAPLEEPGNITLWVDPQRQRRGIATALIREAVRRWNIDFDQQRYTPAGLALIEKFERQTPE